MNAEERLWAEMTPEERAIDAAWWARATPSQRLRAVRLTSQWYEEKDAAEQFRERITALIERKFGA